MYANNIRIKLDKDEKNVKEIHNPEHIYTCTWTHSYIYANIDIIDLD